jgi:DNA polymerase-3 subunit epsilon
VGLVQRSFDDMGTPLSDVTFCVLDLETTGGAPQTDSITEVGAVKVRGGEWLGTFQTLVNPGRAIPPSITVLTGISDTMVLPAPRIESVLPSLAEFVAGAVIVGHNVRFDLGFLNAAFERAGWSRLANPWVDTAALARRLVRDDVANCRLSTLARQLRLDHQPSHRALDDALATTDLLHLLLERAASWGVLGLDDLLALPRLGGHPLADKLRLTTTLPRLPGVYRFLDARGEVLYVGKATNLRQRVRSYFGGEDRRMVGGMLREARRIDHRVCTSTLEAAVVEARLIQSLRPRFNRQGKRWAPPSYVRLTVGEAFPRLSVARTIAGRGALHLGPLASAAAAQQVVDAVHTVVPLRRCAERLPAGSLPKRASPCTAAQLGVAACPCTGQVSSPAYAAYVQQVVDGLTHRPDVLLDPLARRMQLLAAQQRYEEAADVRDRAGALVAALRRQRRLDQLQRAGRVVLELPGGAGAQLEGGLLVRAWGAGPTDRLPGLDDPLPPVADPVGEALVVAAWLDAAWLGPAASRVVLTRCDGELTCPVSNLPSFAPGKDPATRRRAAA